MLHALGRGFSRSASRRASFGCSRGNRRRERQQGSGSAGHRFARPATHESDARSVTPRSHRADRVPFAHHSGAGNFRSARLRLASLPVPPVAVEGNMQRSCSSGCNCRHQATSALLRLQWSKTGEACLTVPLFRLRSHATANDGEMFVRLLCSRTNKLLVSGSHRARPLLSEK